MLSEKDHLQAAINRLDRLIATKRSEIEKLETKKNVLHEANAIIGGEAFDDAPVEVERLTKLKVRQAIAPKMREFITILEPGQIFSAEDTARAIEIQDGVPPRMASVVSALLREATSLKGLCRQEGKNFKVL